MKAGNEMITYDRLWETMKEKGVTQYDLYTHYNVNRAQLNRLRHNKNEEMNTIERLSNILHHRVERKMDHAEDDKMPQQRRTQQLTHTA